MNNSRPGPEPPPVSPLRAAISTLYAGLFFALAGGLLSLHAFADAILPRILTNSPGIEFHELYDGRPVPHLLNWSYPEFSWLNEIREMSGWLFAVLAIVVLWLWLACIRILNPTFRPIRREFAPTVATAANQSISESIPIVESDREQDEGTEASAGLAPEPVVSDQSVMPAAAPAASSIGRTHIILDRVHIEQAVRILIVVGLPVFTIWYVTGGFGNDPIIGKDGQISGNMKLIIELARFLSLGVALFVGYSPGGLAGRFGILSQAYLSDDTATAQRAGMRPMDGLKLAAVGSLFGVILTIAARLAFEKPSAGLLDQFNMMGTFNLNGFGLVASPYFTSVACVWFIAGALLYIIGKLGLKAGVRFGLLLLPCAAFLANYHAGRALKPAEMAARFDITPGVLAVAPQIDPRRPSTAVPVGLAGGELAKRIPVKQVGLSTSPARDMVVFDQRGNFEVQVDSVTDDGLVTDHAAVPAVEAYLKKYRYHSALSWVAAKYLFNDANLRFDVSAELRCGLNDMENWPHEINMGETIRQIFFLCEASPQNLALLDEYADEQKFAHPTRGSMRMMGQLYTRFGDVKKALEWYKRADMPRTFMEQVRTERPLYHAGKVTGKLTWNGKPLAGVQVGAAPRRLNGLPLEMRPLVLEYEGELAALRPDPNPLYPQYHPRPFHLRWIVGGATTGADGSFTLDNLAEGDYVLVCTLPADVRLAVPQDPELLINNPAPSFSLSYGVPNQNLGTIGFQYRK